LHSAATHYAPGLQKPWTAPSLWPQTPQKIRSVDDPHPDLAARQSVAPHAGQTPPSPDGLLANSCAWPASTRRADASARDTSAPRSSANLICRQGEGASLPRYEGDPAALADLRPLPRLIGAADLGRPSALWQHTTNRRPVGTADLRRLDPLEPGSGDAIRRGLPPQRDPQAALGVASNPRTLVVVRRHHKNRRACQHFAILPPDCQWTRSSVRRTLASHGKHQRAEMRSAAPATNRRLPRTGAVQSGRSARRAPSSRSASSTIRPSGPRT
jgi:hypothetical protein